MKNNQILKSYISVVIPAYNEEKRLPKTLESVIEYLRKKEFTSEIIIADDGSEDETVKVAKELLKKFPNKQILKLKHRGKGSAVRGGMLAAEGEFILFMDADNSIAITEFDKFLEQMDKEDSENTVLIGSRRIDKTTVKVKQPPYRRTIKKIGRLFIKSLLIKGVKDTQCGFKMYPQKVAKLVAKNQTIEGWSFDLEQLVIAINHGYSVKEIPVVVVDHPGSKVVIAHDAVKTITELLKIKQKHRKARLKKN